MVNIGVIACGHITIFLLYHVVPKIQLRTDLLYLLAKISTDKQNVSSVNCNVERVRP